MTFHTNTSILRGCYIFCHEDTKPPRKPLSRFFVRASCLRDFVVAFSLSSFGVRGNVQWENLEW